MKVTLVFLTLLISSTTFGQIKQAPLEVRPAAIEMITPPIDTKLDTGKVEIIKDSSIAVLIEKYNSTKNQIGYRIQIHSGLAKVETLKAQSNFMKLYPKVSTYVIYQQPNFKVRVGDFENRLEVNQFFEEMKDAFPGAFIIQDDIAPLSN